MEKTIEKFDIEKRNAEFQAMTLEQKRVAVAKDVIAYVQTGKLLARQSGYLSGLSKLPKETELHTVLTGKGCTVCAIGAVFMSTIGWVDNCRVGDITRFMLDETLIKRTSPVFKPRQLRLMECAFEGRRVGDGYRLISDRHADAAAEWHSKYRSPSARLIAIMENIIANNGTFKP